MVDKDSFYDIGSSLQPIASNNKTATSKPNVAEDNRVKASPLAIKITQGENNMADVDTNYLASQHADIRREAADHTAQLLQENMKGFDRVNADVLKSGWAGVDATKDARYDVATRIAGADKNLSDQATAYFIAGQQNANESARDLASLKVLTDANANRLSNELALNIEKSSAASALAAEKIATAVALGQATLSKEIFADGQKTRDLINDLKYHDLNRALVERNAELVEERESRRHYRHLADQNQFQGQWAALQSQIQAFASQLQETRQGMVNFGTMSGVGQSSTSNNVR